jgi:hypothetical protein
LEDTGLEINAACQAAGFPLPTPAAFPSFPAPLQAALFTNEDPEGLHAANLQNRPS